MVVKGKTAEQEAGPSEPSHDATVEIVPLGAGQEVGRSCIIVRYMGKTVMLDCGIHPGYTGLASLPFLDEVDLGEVDLMVVTHFHLDHCAAVPYVVGHTNFQGRIIMTHPTKAIYATLLRDFVKVARGSSGSDEALYSEKDLEASLDRIEVADFYQTIDVGGIQLTLYRAGHVLGAAMAMVQIGSARVLYTGDYSRVPDRHLAGADIPPMAPDILIVESTYGVGRHLPREERELRFVQTVRAVVQRGGKCLLPVVALGRAQELLLILEEYWEKHPELQNVPIYQTSGLARRAMTVYQTYIEMMSDDIKAAFQMENPFEFKHVTHQTNFDDVGTCVVMATPSMLQSGKSRELFEAWCEDRKNGIIIADFAVQGTLAREILGEPAEVTTSSGIKVPLRATVDAISFSAHADFPQTSEFIDALQPPHVVLVHGEATEMQRLRKALEQRAEALGQTRNLYTPKVTQPVHIKHKTQRVAKVVGRLADKPLSQGSHLRGLLVGGQLGQPDSVLDPQDLPAYTTLRTCRITQRQAVALNRPFTEVRSALELMFEGLQGTGDIGLVTGQGPPGADGTQVLRVSDTVTVTYKPAAASSVKQQQGKGGAAAVVVGGGAAHVVLEWEGGSAADMVADAVVAVILQAAGEPLAMTAAESQWRGAIQRADLEAAAAAELQLIAALMRTQFGPAVVDEKAGRVVVQVDSHEVVVDHASSKVTCGNEALRSRVERSVARIIAALQPVAMEADE